MPSNTPKAPAPKQNPLLSALSNVVAPFTPKARAARKQKREEQRTIAAKRKAYHAKVDAFMEAALEAQGGKRNADYVRALINPPKELNVHEVQYASFKVVKGLHNALGISHNSEGRDIPLAEKPGLVDEILESPWGEPLADFSVKSWQQNRAGFVHQLEAEAMRQQVIDAGFEEILANPS